MANAPLDLHGYVAELDSWSATAGDLKYHPEEAAAAKKNLPSAWLVIIDGQRVEVPTFWLRAELETIEKNSNNRKAIESSVHALQTRLAAMRAEAAALAEPGSPETAQVRGTLETILQRREFQMNRGALWLKRLRERVNAALAYLLAALLARSANHPKIARGVLWALALGLVAACLVGLARLLLRPRRRSFPPQEAGTAAKSWQELATAAFSAAASQNYRDAVRLAYWAGIYRLEELGAWQVDPARTHREYLRLLSESDPRRAAVSAISSRFERIWYGGQAASAEQFQFILARLEELGCLFPSNPVTASS